MKKRSKIIVEMAETVLIRPANLVSDEAAHAALLLAHVAWNREVQPDSTPSREEYEMLLRALANSNREFAKDLKSGGFGALITELRSYKRRRYLTDARFITICGTTPAGNVHVELR